MYVVIIYYHLYVCRNTREKLKDEQNKIAAEEWLILNGENRKGH